MNEMMRPHEPEAARDAVHRLFAGALRAGFKLAGLHRCNTSDGAELLRVVRLKHPGWADLADTDRDALRQRHQCDGKGKIVRKMHRDGTHYVAKAPAKPAHGWPLYRPPYPLVDTDPTIVCEGEACADALARLGMTATTSGSATSADGADWSPQAGRSGKLLWPDHDAPGAKHMADVAGHLRAIGCDVRMIDVSKLNLPEGGDVVDWLALHPNATAADVLALEICKPPFAPPAATDAPRVELIEAASVKPEAVRWLWPGWLARGKLHVLAGAPSTCKTMTALHWASCISAGRAFPGGHRPAPGRVVIWSGEDGIEDTLVPRMLAAGADLSRVQFVGQVHDAGQRFAFDPARDVPLLTDALAGSDDVALIVVDPLVSAVSGDSHKNAEVRRSLSPLVELAERMNAALLGITHYSKGTTGRDPLERVSGSLAFGALARIVYGTAKRKPEGDDTTQGGFILARCKSNIGPDGGGFAYASEVISVAGGIDACRVVWGAPLEGTARDLLAEAEAQPEDDDRQDAAGFLRDLLSDGPASRIHVEDAARKAGIAWRTVQRAMKEAGVTSRRDGFGKPAVWSMVGSRASYATVAPVTPHSESGADGATGEEVARLDDVEAFDL